MHTPRLTRRSAIHLAGLAAIGAQSRIAPAAAQPAPASPAIPPAPARLPIVFVHGNGDTAGLWITTLWRFESLGYPRDLLHAVDLRRPNARSVDATPQPGRSSTGEVMRQLAEEVAFIRAATGADRVVLVGQSRGGNTVRNFLLNGGGAAVCPLAILCGAVSHGVIRSEKALIGSEFNGDGPFLRGLNAAPGEIAPGVRAVTIRSDAFDKFAQPDGRYLGLPGTPTGIGFDAPALSGGKDIVIPGLDHRETGFAPEAFAAMWEEITGSPPADTLILPQSPVTLSGRITGWEAGSPTNLPMSGVGWEVFAISPETGARIGPALAGGITASDGQWGPIQTGPTTPLEIVVIAPDLPVNHIYRSPFPRSSDLVHIRPIGFDGAEAQAAHVLVVTRPRGYFGPGERLPSIAGTPAPGIPPGVPTLSTSRLSLPPGTAPVQPVAFRTERIPARLWPAAEGHISVAEITS